MKRYLALFFALALILVFPSCSGEKQDSDKLSVVTTIFPQYDFARAVASEVADRVELTMLLPPGSESHDYEPSIADLALIESCDLFICVGGETDSWVDGAIEAVGGDVNVLRLVDLVPLLAEAENGIIENSHKHEHDEEAEHDEAEHDEEAGHDGSDHKHTEVTEAGHAENDLTEQEHEHEEHKSHAEYDEHVWTSPENAVLITKAICDAMCTAEPSLADSFRRGAERYIGVLEDLSGRFSALAESAVRHTVYFADRFPFLYLTDFMGLDFCAAFAGCSSDSEPALSTIYAMTEALKASDSKVIFTTEFSSKNAASVIARECSLQVTELHSCHNVSKEDFERGVTYAELMEKNLAVLTEALT